MAARPRRAALFEPTQSLAGIGRKTTFRELAIVDDIEASRDLLLDDLGDRATDPRGESRLIVGFPSSLAMSIARRSSGRGKLPACVVRIRSVLRCMVPPPCQATA